jgi:hypothetical protein
VAEPTGTDLTRLKALVARQRRELDAMRSQAAARSVVDLATGMLMEQLHCSPAQARRQLGRLARESDGSVAGLAAQLTGQLPPDEADDPADPGPRGLSLAWAAAQVAPDGDAVAAALLDEALAATGAVAVALWLLEPDGAWSWPARPASGHARLAAGAGYTPTCRPSPATPPGMEWRPGGPQARRRPMTGR